MRKLPFAVEGQLVQTGLERQMAFIQLAKLPRLTKF